MVTIGYACTYVVKRSIGLLLTIWLIFDWNWNYRLHFVAYNFYKESTKSYRMWRFFFFFAAISIQFQLRIFCLILWLWHYSSYLQLKCLFCIVDHTDNVISPSKIEKRTWCWCNVKGESCVLYMSHKTLLILSGRNLLKYSYW